MKKIMIVFGTRPEFIKMAPLCIELTKRGSFKTCICSTGQHKEMLDKSLNIFDVNLDYNLKIMKKEQSLTDITVSILTGIGNIMDIEKPDMVLVHGDTTTAFAAGLAAFYRKIPVGHVEAGLRTHCTYSPWPEEFNRVACDAFSELFFAPTERSVENLISEGRNKDKIYVTGNTVIDSFKYTVTDDFYNKELEWAKDSRLILLTAHRRENLGVPLHNIFSGIRDLIEERDDTKVIYPIHMNPSVRKIAREVFEGCEKIHLIEPLNVFEFHNFMSRSDIIMTDSGGIQEEAPFFGKPVLLLRNDTERPEGIEAGTVKLVGTNRKNIYKELKNLIINKDKYLEMSCKKNPYGDGHASERIVDIMEDYF